MQVQPDKTYRIALWRKLEKVNVFTGTPAGTQAQPYLRVGQQRSDGKWNRYEDFKLGEGTIDWDELEFMVTTLPDTVTVSIEILMKYSSGIMWVDDITLEEATDVGSISFISVPSGAGIFLDNKDTGKNTPATVSGVMAGLHAYVLKLSGYNDAAGTVMVEAGRTAQVSANLVAVLTTGSVNVSSSPSGAEVYIDGVSRGVTPVILRDIAAGTHTFRLKLSGYQDSEGSVIVEAGQTAVISAALTRIITAGDLDISSVPPGADIYIDGTKLSGVTPQVVPGLSEGTHGLVLKLAGYRDYGQSFNIIAVVS